MTNPPATTSERSTRPSRRKPRRILPKLWELPIPADVRPGPGWTAQMREMADHIGPHATLTIVAHFGGQEVYIPRDPANSPFAGIVDERAAKMLAQVYCGNRMQLPVARSAVDRARRAVVVEGVRAGMMSVADGAKVLGTGRTYMSYLVNHSAEGQDGAAARHVEQLEPRQRDLFSLPAPD